MAQIIPFDSEYFVMITFYKEMIQKMLRLCSGSGSEAKYAKTQKQ